MRVTSEQNPSLSKGKSIINSFLMRVTGKRNPSLSQEKSNLNPFLIRVTGERNPSLSKGKSNLNLCFVMRKAWSLFFPYEDNRVI